MSASLVWTEIKLLAREPLVLVVSLLLPVLLMVLLMVSFQEENDPVFGDMAGADFYLLAYLAAGVAVMGFMAVPTHLSSYRQSGVLRRFSAAGVPAGALIVAHVAVLAVLSALSAAVMIPLGRGVFDAAVPEGVMGSVASFVLGILAFGAIGTLLGTVLPTPRLAQGLGLLLFFGTFFLAGGGPPPSLLPDAVNTAADVTPVGMLINALKSPWMGNGLDVAPMLGLATIMLTGFALTFRWIGRAAAE